MSPVLQAGADGGAVQRGWRTAVSAVAGQRTGGAGVKQTGSTGWAVQPPPMWGFSFFPSMSALAVLVLFADPRVGVGPVLLKVPSFILLFLGFCFIPQFGLSRFLWGSQVPLQLCFWLPLFSVLTILVHCVPVWLESRCLLPDPVDWALCSVAFCFQIKFWCSNLAVVSLHRFVF